MLILSNGYIAFLVNVLEGQWPGQSHQWSSPLGPPDLLTPLSYLS